MATHHPVSLWARFVGIPSLDLEQSLQIIGTLDDDPALPPPYNVLMDLRDAPCDLTLTDVTEVVACMERRWKAFNRKRKIAVVVDGKVALDKAEFMELYAQNRGFQVEAFDDLDAAKAWLEVDTPSPEAKGDPGRERPSHPERTTPR